ncbi:uncharacterized protein LOC131490374 [Neofelis nebulosa]|uniref:uncharacterized protein LOC131490374 n=1 Tax=Neofelis nebulosa TaxID=61452 RepID=UPI00272D7A40|nr:uncharacterized protein LOC131490374 [Neofelis nebulosa]
MGSPASPDAGRVASRFPSCLSHCPERQLGGCRETGPKGLVTKELETRGLRLSRSRSIGPLAQASFIFANYLITASTYNIAFGILTGRAPAVYSILGHEYIWHQTKHSYPRPGARMMSFWRERAVTAAFRPGNETAFSFLAALSLSFRTFLWCLQLLVLQWVLESCLLSPLPIPHDFQRCAGVSSPGLTWNHHELFLQAPSPVPLLLRTFSGHLMCSI